MDGQDPESEAHGNSEFTRELDLVSELFHRINRVLPATQQLLTIAPEMMARDAIALMRNHSYSQLPVVAGGEVLGVFSFRSFAVKAAALELQDIIQHKCAPTDLCVDECLEKFDYARVTAEMREVFDAMERDNGILIGSPESLQGILTPMDFLRYFYGVASPFVMLSEIELALRALIRVAVDDREIAELAERSLAKMYEPDRIPRTLGQMTFDNYRAIITHGDNWPKFEPVLGANRSRTGAKLKQIGEIRNDLFHFKRPMTADDHEVLNSYRDWLLLKAKLANSQKKQTGAA